LFIVLVFACGLSGFVMGVGVSDRAGVAQAGLLTQAYYTLGLFVLGGMDLGVPVGGPRAARALLWFAYFAAPTITASAVIEGLLRAIRPRHWALRRLRHHVVIAGCGKLTMLYLERIRECHPRKRIVIVEPRLDRSNVEQARAIYGAIIVNGDITSDILLATLRLNHADGVLLLTGDDFTNLDAAAKILRAAPKLGRHIVVHVADLQFLRAMAGTHVATECTVFNSHQIAAKHLVLHELLDYFMRTKPLDTVVVAGFGRFGQTVLSELQSRAADKFDRVVLIDFDCRRRASMFAEQVGFSDGYELEVLDGDLRDPELLKRIDESVGGEGSEAAFVLGSGDDSTNMQAALGISKKHPKAFIVARNFRPSRFAAEIAEGAGFLVFNVADLVRSAVPDHWLTDDKA
jgi:voltage-gated potassium channel Kch